MNIYIFIKMKISGNCEMWKRRGASHFFFFFFIANTIPMHQPDRRRDCLFPRLTRRVNVTLV
ncbi:hypothetical protein FQ033_26105, partial [Escherichia coli]|nr:hypothetical protein [Escherichia coli]